MSSQRDRKNLNTRDSSPNLKNVLKNIPLSVVQSLGKSPKTPKTPMSSVNTSNTPSTDKAVEKRKINNGKRSQDPLESPRAKRLALEAADASAKAVQKPAQKSTTSEATTPQVQKLKKEGKKNTVSAGKEKLNTSQRKKLGKKQIQAEVLKFESESQIVSSDDEEHEVEEPKQTNACLSSSVSSSSSPGLGSLLNLPDEDDADDEDFEVGCDELEGDSEDGSLEEEEDFEEDTNDCEGDLEDDDDYDSDENNIINNTLDVLKEDLLSEDDADDEDWTNTTQTVENSEEDEETSEEEENNIVEDNHGEDVSSTMLSSSCSAEQNGDESMDESSEELASNDENSKKENDGDSEDEVPTLIDMAENEDKEKPDESFKPRPPGARKVVLKNLPEGITQVEVSNFIQTHLPKASVGTFEVLPKRQVVIEFLKGTHKHAMRLQGRECGLDKLSVTVLPAKPEADSSSEMTVAPPRKKSKKLKKHSETSELPMDIDDSGEVKNTTDSPPKKHRKKKLLNGLGSEDATKEEGERKVKKKKKKQQEETDLESSVEAKGTQEENPVVVGTAASQLRLVVSGMPTAIPAAEVRQRLRNFLSKVGAVRKVRVLDGVPCSFHISVVTMADPEGHQAALDLRGPCLGEHGLDISSGCLAEPLLLMLAAQKKVQRQGVNRKLQQALRCVQDPPAEKQKKRKAKKKGIMKKNN